LSCTPRRRRRSAEEKAAVVAASLAPGAVARRAALRHGVHPNQLYASRRVLASVDGAGAEPFTGFVPVAVSRLAVARDQARERRSRSRWATPSCVRRRGSRWVF
jgi:transposase